MKRMNVILKATEGCNLRCKYCYNCETNYSADIMPLERLEKLFELLAASYDSVSITWHGGEPLLVGKEYMKKAMEIEDRIYRATGVPFMNSVQTNATMIDAEWVKFFKRYRFKVGVSFDGMNNSDYRQQTEKALEAIDLLRKKNISFGCLAVVADDSYDMIANYKFFAERGLHFALSPMFSEGGGESMPALSEKEFARKLKELFDYWIYDTKGVNVRTFSDYISMMLGSHTRTCTNGSCHGKWLGVTPDGNLYNCGRDAMRDYCFGNVDDMENISEAFNSDGFRRLLVGAISRRNKCSESCPLFRYCESGCSDCAILENGLENIPGFSCYCFREIFPHVNNAMRRIVAEKTPLSKLNPSIRLAVIQCMSEHG